MNGVVAVSPFLNPTIDENGDLSPLGWVVSLPSIAAAHLERPRSLTTLVGHSDESDARRPPRRCARRSATTRLS